MNLPCLLIRNLRHYWRANLGIMLGAAISGAVLIGALIVGDSVRYSLCRLSLDRLGRTEYALVAGEHFFRQDLADAIARSGVLCAPLIQARGVAVAGGGRARVNHATILGVDARFYEFGNRGSGFDRLADDEAIVNAAIAARLGLKVGDRLLLRVRKATPVSLDVPFVAKRGLEAAMTLRIRMILPLERFGDFSLAVSQVPPFNVFVPLSRLARLLGRPGQANVMIAAGRHGAGVERRRLEIAMRCAWRIEDVGLELRQSRSGDFIELTCGRIFISPDVEAAALDCGRDARAVFGYFVNSISFGSRSCPYSFVAGAGAPLVPADLRDNEIMISDWLARDLAVKVGDGIALDYYVIGPGQKLRTRRSTFRVRRVLPLTGNAMARGLIPDFPGLADVENCRDWDSSLPIDLSRIRKQDEEFWQRFGRTPKALVSVNAARAMWGNRFGGLTAVRYPLPGNDLKSLAAQLAARISPSSAGFVFDPIRARALAAGNNAVDFGMLFLGLSFFLIVSALMLVGLFFGFAVEARSMEISLLRAVGFTRRAVKALFLGEGLLLAVLGGLPGVVLGVAYNRAILFALGSVWRGATGTSHLHPRILAGTLLLGFAANIVVAGVCILIALRRMSGISIAGLHAEAVSGGILKPGRWWPSMLVEVLALVTAGILLLGFKAGSGGGVMVVFLVAGALLLTAGLAACNLQLLRYARGSGRALGSINALAISNCSRRRGQSMAVIATLAAGIFLVVGIGANRGRPAHDSRAAGTGGFALYGETAMPLALDLNLPRTRAELGLKTNAVFVQLKARDGDEASCLNLNRVTSPRILGVDPGELDSRKAFSFAGLTGESDRNAPWSVALDRVMDDGAIPAVADQEVITWALGRKLGDELLVTDEHGRRVRLRLVGGLKSSIFQGSVIVSARNFDAMFPGTGGTRIMLVDAPADRVGQVAEELSFALEDYGLDLEPARTRLERFNVVRNTYLTIFLILGGLGVALGTCGLGVVILRNINERKQELELLRALGFRQREIRYMLLVEHAWLISMGLACGIPAALVAVG